MSEHTGKDGDPQVLTAVATTSGERLDRFLVRHLPDFSRSRLQALIRAGAVMRDGTCGRRPRPQVKAGETYVVRVPPPAPPGPQPQAIPLAVVYEDAHLIVIDKPQGPRRASRRPATRRARWSTPSSPIAGRASRASAASGGRASCTGSTRTRPGSWWSPRRIAAHRGLSEQFAAHGADGRLERGYRAHRLGRAGSAARRDRRGARPQHRQPHQDRRRRARRAGRRAVTRYEVLETFACRRPQADRQPAASSCWRPAARTRSACISPTSATRCSAT